MLEHEHSTISQDTLSSFPCPVSEEQGGAIIHRFEPKKAKMSLTGIKAEVPALLEALQSQSFGEESSNTCGHEKVFFKEASLFSQ